MVLQAEAQRESQLKLQQYESAAQTQASQGHLPQPGQLAVVVGFRSQPLLVLHCRQRSAQAESQCRLQQDGSLAQTQLSQMHPLQDRPWVAWQPLWLRMG